MKTVVVFGSGHVSRPAVRTLLDNGHRVLVATDQPEAGEELIAGHPAGSVVEVDAGDREDVRASTRKGDAVISLLPVQFHVRVAEACLAEGRPFVTTSYVSEEMRALDGAARRADLLLLNETGADPGIDHMQAMRLVHRVQEEGGRITGLRSLCGGIPSPDANNNPLGYKISWSTRGVVLAGSRAARFVEDGELVHVEPFGIFAHSRPLAIESLGMLESYPNGDSVRFEEEYGLSGLHTMFRGTLRWPGWCETWKALVRLGYVDEGPDAALAHATYAEEARRACGGHNGDDPRETAAIALGLTPDHAVLDRLEWLGLFADRPVPAGAGSRADLLIHLMEQALQYGEGERDMVALYHEVEYEVPQGGSRALRATLTEYGVPGGDSAMSRTVGIPAAFAAIRVLDGSIRETGVRIPVARGIYGPILADLAAVGIEEELEPVP